MGDERGTADAEEPRSSAQVHEALLAKRLELPKIDLAPRSMGPASIPLTPGTVVADKFALQRIIASGGMGTVFEAWDTLVERKVALKLMHPQFASDPSMVARFRREAQAAARIQHPNVVNVLEVGRRRDGTFYIVQELLVGVTLREHLDARHHLPPEEMLGLVVPVMSGIAAAHASGIVHRDLKPENIILARTPSGEVIPKIIDFGLAKLHDANKQSLTRLGTLLGTPQYMAPEQVLAERIDSRVDIWAMGVVVFEMLSGILPFTGDSLAAVLGRIVSSEPPPDLAFVSPTAAAPFAPIVRRALERDPSARYQTIREFRDALVGALGSSRVLVANASDTARFSVAPADVGSHDDPAFDAPPAEVTDSDDVEPIPIGEKQVKRLQLTPLPATQTEWGAAIDKKVNEDPVKLAQDALEVNALLDAIRWAEVALANQETTDDERGRAWLVLAIAQRWLGHYSEAVRAAQEALLRLPRGSSGWHAAFGHLVIAYGYLGRKDRLLARVDELATVEEEEGVKTEGHLVSACRLAVFVMRSGVPQLGRRLVREAHHFSMTQTGVGPFLRGWLATARAELALVEGDPAAYLRRVEAAVDAFTEASDVRNACLQRTNVGHAYMLLGAYDRAKFVLERAIAVAEPMQLDFVPIAKANLGFCQASLGLWDDAHRTIDAAILPCRKRNDRRRLSLLLMVSARVRSMQGNYIAASGLARAAAEDAEDSPLQRAQALGCLAEALLAEGDNHAALAAASEAAGLAERLGNLEEGDTHVRLMHVLALRAVGQEAEARRRLVEGKKVLLAQADKIKDRRFRKSFLENVPENRKLLELAASL